MRRITPPYVCLVALLALVSCDKREPAAVKTAELAAAPAAAFETAPRDIADELNRLMVPVAFAYDFDILEIHDHMTRRSSLAHAVDESRGVLRIQETGDGSSQPKAGGAIETFDFVLTSEIPLARVTVVLRDSDVTSLDTSVPALKEIAFNCPPLETCIATFDKAQSESGASLKSVYCRTENCERALADYRALIAHFANARRAANQAAPPADAPAGVERALAQTIGKINAAIDTQRIAPAGLPTTERVGWTQSGTVALAGNCAIESDGQTRCDKFLEFPPDKIDSAALSIQTAGGGLFVIFSCASGERCITSPNGDLRYAGYGLACRDQTECNRLVTDFASLLNLMSAR